MSTVLPHMALAMQAQQQQQWIQQQQQWVQQQQLRVHHQVRVPPVIGSLPPPHYVTLILLLYGGNPPRIRC